MIYAWQGRRGMAGMARCGRAGLGRARRGMAGETGHGRQGRVWLGKAWRGKARLVGAGMAGKEVKNLVYDWVVPGLYPVSAKDAMDDLQRIYSKHGRIDAADVVNESRAENAVLHNCFEWNDEIAAEKYRKTQAEDIIRAIVVVNEEQKEPVKVRAIVHVQSSYQPISVVVNDKDKLSELLASALRELQAFRRKYESLASLKPVMDAIEAVSA